MYDTWIPVELVEPCGSVLSKFDPSVGRSVTTSLIGELIKTLSASVKPTLDTEEEVEWCLEVLSFGLKLSFGTDYATLRDSVRIHTDWLSCLSKDPHSSVPQAIKERPTFYAKRLLSSLLNLFEPRTESNNELTLKQTKECHYVLRVVQSTVESLASGQDDEILLETLSFMMRVGDILLTGPFEVDDLSDQLCSRILTVLLELWLTACSKGSFPSPCHWRRLRELIQQWRHHRPVVDKWAGVTLALTNHVLSQMFGDDYSQMLVDTADSQMLPAALSESPETLIQVWFRVLHLFGSPSDLSSIGGFLSSAPNYRQLMVQRGVNGNIYDHVALQQLPFLFFRAIYGVSLMVGGYLGESVNGSMKLSGTNVYSTLPTSMSDSTIGPTWSSQTQQTLMSPATPNLSVSSHQSLKTPMNTLSFVLPGSTSRSEKFGTGTHRESSLKTGLSGSKSVISTNMSVPTQSASLPAAPTFNGNQVVHDILSGKLSIPHLNSDYAAKRPNVDSLFHLFGDWLFSAAAVKSVQPRASSRADDTMSVKSDSSQHSGSTEVSAGVMMESRNWSAVESAKEVYGNEAGKSEAIAVVLKILCSKKTDETISPTYVARVFAVLCNSLCNPSERLVLANSLVFGVNLFRVGLKEAYILIPLLLPTLEVVLRDTVKGNRFHPSIPLSELRRAAVYLLSSLVSVPFQFGQTVVSNSLSPLKQGESATTTLHNFVPNVAKLLIDILGSETDSFNLQLGLGVSAVFCSEIAQQMIDTTPTEADHQSDGNAYITRFCRVLVSNLLESRFVDDYAICMAAMDTLLILSKYVDLRDVEVGRAVISVLCKVVEKQLSRPPPAHSRDLHSTVVSAYHTVGVWLIALPLITHHRDTLNDVTRVIELGLTGTTETSSTPPKPASQRVRDAAEHLSLTLFTKLGDGFSMHSACTNEQWVAQRQMKTKDGPLKFKYFLLDNSVLVALMEEKPDLLVQQQIQAGTSDKRPGLFLLIRSVTGLEAWTGNLRFRSSEEESKPLPPLSVARPIGVDTVIRPRSVPRCFPPEVDEIQQCKADKSLPELKLTPEAEKLRPMFQVSFSNSQDTTELQSKDLQPPKPVMDINLTRLLLNDLGYLRPEQLMPGNQTQVVELNADSMEFTDSLAALDSMSDRLCCTAFVYYVAAEQTGVLEILKNGNNVKQLSPAYCRFLANLGRIVSVSELNQWSNGFHQMSKERQSGDDTPVNRDELRLDGSDYAIYWSDPSSELLLSVPSSLSSGRRMSHRTSIVGSGRDRAVSSPKDAPEPLHIIEPLEETQNLREVQRQIQVAFSRPRARSSSVSETNLLATSSRPNELKSPTEKLSFWKSHFSWSKRDLKQSRTISKNEANNNHHAISLKISPEQSMKLAASMIDPTPVRKTSAPENQYGNLLTVTPPTTPHPGHSQGRRSSLKTFFGGSKKEKKTNKYLKLPDTESLRKLTEVNSIDSPKRHLSPQKFHFPRFFSHLSHSANNEASVTKLDPEMSSDDSDGQSEFEDQLANLPELIDLHSPVRDDFYGVNSKTAEDGQLMSPPIYRNEAMRQRSCSIDLAELPVRRQNWEQFDPDVWSAKSQPSNSLISELGAPVPPPRSKSLSHQGSLQCDDVILRSHPGLLQQPAFVPDQSRNSVAMRPKTLKPPTEWRTLIVWLEQFEDLNRVPIDELIFATEIAEGSTVRSESCVVIFIHPMGELCRLSVKGNWGKLGFALPIMDGLVVREGILPSLIQQTILSVGRRRRLEQEGFQMSHMKRRQKLQELGLRFGKKPSMVDFYIELLTKSH